MISIFSHDFIHVIQPQFFKAKENLLKLYNYKYSPICAFAVRISKFIWQHNLKKNKQPFFVHSLLRFMNEKKQQICATVLNSRNTDIDN